MPLGERVGMTTEEYREYRKEYWKKKFTKEKQKELAENTKKRKLECLKSGLPFIPKNAKKSKSEKQEVQFRGALKRNFGITPEFYYQLLQDQLYHCPICGLYLEEKDRCVDHCHTSGKVRGILHRKCNLAVGCSMDSISSVRGLITYIQMCMNGYGIPTKDPIPRRRQDTIQRMTKEERKESRRKNALRWLNANKEKAYKRSYELLKLRKKSKKEGVPYIPPIVNRKKEGKDDTLRIYKKHLLQKFGGAFTYENYQELLESQDRKCLICGNGFIERHPAVDHCHQTNKIRGILHSYCNTLVGLCNEDILTAQNLLAYLINHNNERT